MDADIVIVGAGFSGVVSAYNLTDNGHYEYPYYTELHRKIILSLRYRL